VKINYIFKLGTPRRKFEIGKTSNIHGPETIEANEADSDAEGSPTQTGNTEKTSDVAHEKTTNDTTTKYHRCFQKLKRNRKKLTLILALCSLILLTTYIRMNNLHSRIRLDRNGCVEVFIPRGRRKIKIKEGQQLGTTTVKQFYGQSFSNSLWRRENDDVCDWFAAEILNKIL